MPLTYDSKKIVPGPLVTLNKTYRASEDGGKLGSQYDITLHGTLLPFRGSPSGHYTVPESGFWTLGGDPPDEVYQGNNEDFNSLLRKQEALRWLFGRDGKSLEWQPSGGQPVVKCNPRVTNLSFAEGQWADRCDYTIELTADWVYINGTRYEDDFALGLIAAASDQWTFDEIIGREGQSYQVTHTISANGLIGYDVSGSLLDGKAGWEHARDWVEARVSGSIDPAVMRAAIGADDWISGSYTKGIVTDKTAGSFQIAETWLVGPSDHYTEKTFLIEWDSNYCEYRIRYEGLIVGLAAGLRSGSSEALTAAKAAVPSIANARAEATAMVSGLLDGKTLLNYPDVKTVALNQKEGTATFSFEWSTSENTNATVVFTANLAWNADSGLYTLSLTQEIQGHGMDPATKLGNAKAAMLIDSQARTKALALVADQLPPGATISNTLKAKSSSINERQGIISLSWTWDDSPEHNLDVVVTIKERGAVTAIIPIPGRIQGPIVQDMNTTSEKTAQVSIRGQHYDSKPVLADMLTLAHTYLGIASIGFKIATPTEAWNPIRKTYSLDVSYLILEGY